MKLPRFVYMDGSTVGVGLLVMLVMQVLAVAHTSSCYIGKSTVLSFHIFCNLL